VYCYDLAAANVTFTACTAWFVTCGGASFIPQPVAPGTLCFNGFLQFATAPPCGGSGRLLHDEDTLLMAAASSSPLHSCAAVPAIVMLHEAGNGTADANKDRLGRALAITSAAESVVAAQVPLTAMLGSAALVCYLVAH
jgi:hypothetical protein